MSGLGTGTATDDEIKRAIGDYQGSDKPLVTELWLRIKKLETAKPASK